MTNPVILLGTQSNGETLPVQVDATGRLVAEGLQGAPGPEGPPGVGALPPDPFEGAFLGWINGELAWINSSVPIAPGVFGPITAWDPVNNILTVEGGIPESVGPGVYLYQCEPDGTFFTQGFDTSAIWSDNTAASYTNGAQLNPGRSVEGFFNGSLVPAPENSWGIQTGGGEGTGTLTFTSPFQGTRNVTLYTWSGSAAGAVWVNKGLSDEQSLPIETGQKSPTFTVNTLSNVALTFPGGGGGTNLLGLQIGTELIVDTNESLNFRVSTLLDQSILGVPSQAVNFTVGKYLAVPAQRVAPWVLYGNDPTSLIDHLRR